MTTSYVCSIHQSRPAALWYLTSDEAKNYIVSMETLFVRILQGMEKPAIFLLFFSEEKPMSTVCWISIRTELRSTEKNLIMSFQRRETPTQSMLSRKIPIWLWSECLKFRTHPISLALCVKSNQNGTVAGAVPPVGRPGWRSPTYCSELDPTLSSAWLVITPTMGNHAFRKPRWSSWIHYCCRLALDPEDWSLPVIR